MNDNLLGIDIGLLSVCLLIVLGIVVALWLPVSWLRNWRDAKKTAKRDSRVDDYLAMIKPLNADTIKRKGRLLEDVKARSPFLKIQGKRQAAYWNSVLNALAQCQPMEEDKLVGIAVLFANLEADFGHVITPNHLEKEAKLIAKAERNWRKLLDLTGSSNPQA